MSNAEKTEKSENFLPAGFRQGVCCTYLLKCADGSLYCGWTNHLERRLQAHNAGTGGKYTRARRPVTLIYAESFDTKEEAMRREWHIKHLSRTDKIRMIQAAGMNGGTERIFLSPDGIPGDPPSMPVSDGEAERLK